MPLYSYTCPCGETFARIRKVSEASDPSHCPVCGEEALRTPTGPTTRAMETWDNGFMTKAVVRPADAEQLYRERGRMPKEKEK